MALVIKFLKEHIVGVVVLALITGVLGNFIYDAIKPTPRDASGGVYPQPTVTSATPTVGTPKPSEPAPNRPLPNVETLSLDHLKTPTASQERSQTDAIAVLPIGFRDHRSTALTEFRSEPFRSRLESGILAQKKGPLITVRDVDKLLNEQQRQGGVFFDPTTRAQAGKLIGARRVMFLGVDIAAVEAIQQEVNGRTFRGTKARVALQLSTISTETGEVLSSRTSKAERIGFQTPHELFQSAFEEAFLELTKR